MADRFEDLRNYGAVVDNGGINAAAASLEIAKSAVSRRLSELEERLGATLIIRSTRRFEPTEVGRHYYERARPLLDELGELDTGFGKGADTTPVTLIVAVDRALGTSVAAALAPLVRSSPGLTIRIVDDAWTAVEADLWLGIAPTDASRFSRLSVNASPLLIVGSPALLDQVGKPTSLADLRDRAGIATASRAGSGWTFHDEVGRSPRFVITVPDDASAVAAAVASAGLARVPLNAAATAIAAGDLERLLASSEDVQSVDVWIRKDGPASVRQVADAIAKDLGTSVAAGSGSKP